MSFPPLLPWWDGVITSHLGPSTLLSTLNSCESLYWLLLTPAFWPRWTAELTNGYKDKYSKSRLTSCPFSRTTVVGSPSRAMASSATSFEFPLMEQTSDPIGKWLVALCQPCLYCIWVRLVGRPVLCRVDSPLDMFSLPSNLIALSDAEK